MTDQPADQLTYLTAPRRPAEEHLEQASDLHRQHDAPLGLVQARTDLAIGEALVRIADHLEELLEELREQRARSAAVERDAYPFGRPR